MVRESRNTLPVGIGAVGASITAERGGNNWTEQLGKWRRDVFTFGSVVAWQQWFPANPGGPKYEFIHSHFPNPQHNDPDPFGTSAEVRALAQNIRTGAVTVGYLENGDSFALHYDDIYHGKLCGLGLTKFIDGFCDEMEKAIVVLTRAGSQSPSQSVQILLGNVGDFDVTPFIDLNPSYPDASRRKVFVDAVGQANRQLQALAAKYGISLLDLCGWSELARPSQPPVYVGGVELNKSHHVELGSTANPAPNANPTLFPCDFFVDAQHPGPIAQALLANMVILALTTASDSPLLNDQAAQPFSDHEILTHWLPGKTSYFDVRALVAVP